MSVLVIVYLAVLTWQTMGAFRCARRIDGFWSIVAIVVFGVVWLGEIVENFDVLLPLGVVLIIWFFGHRYGYVRAPYSAYRCAHWASLREADPG